MRLNRNTTLLEAFTERLVRKSTTIPFPRDRARNTKLNTILKKDNKKEKDNIFNTPTTLKEYINFAAIVKEGKNMLYFQVVNLVTSYTI